MRTLPTLDPYRILAMKNHQKSQKCKYQKRVFKVLCVISICIILTVFEYKAIKIIKVAPKKRCRIVIYESREYSCVNKRVHTVLDTMYYPLPSSAATVKIQGKKNTFFFRFFYWPNIRAVFGFFFQSRYNNCNNDQREKKSATCIITTNWFFLDLQGLQAELKYIFLYLRYLHNNFSSFLDPISYTLSSLIRPTIFRTMY